MTAVAPLAPCHMGKKLNAADACALPAVGFAPRLLRPAPGRTVLPPAMTGFGLR
jgi:hypothetical protein